jgi:hypothetical protein
MKKLYFLFTLCAAILLISCVTKSKSETTIDNSQIEEFSTLPTAVDKPIFSFAFVGCNRVNWKDQIPAVPSAANLPVLQRIFDDLDSIAPHPKLLFFLGDMVEGENTIRDLRTQLDAWVKRYEDSLKISGIELVAIPGNHEMLHYGDPEYPLKGATNTWMKHMTPYMPIDRDIITTDSLNNRATFSFVRHNTAFVVMNTDTYNEDSLGNHGVEGMIAFKWIKKKIEHYRGVDTVDHIFVLGHKPAYFDGSFHTLHAGFPDSEKLWSVLRKNEVSALLSAHKHCYYRGQPYGDSTYQIIAGNGGSSFNGAKEPPLFFGYSVIHVYANQPPRLESIGFKSGQNYNDPVPTINNASLPRDTAILRMDANPNKGFGSVCE